MVQKKSNELSLSKQEFHNIELGEKKDTIIIFASVHFRKDLWQRPQQLAVQFQKKGYRVIYVHYNFKNVNIEKPYNRKQRIELYNDMFLKAKEDEGILLVDTLECLTDKDGKYHWIKEEYFEQLIKFFVGKATKLITYIPSIADVLKKAKINNLNIKVYFDCVDDISGFQGKKIIPYEERLIKNADGVIVTSKTLYVHKSRLNKNCILVPNGVNVEEFSKDYSKPRDLEKLKGPIIGYVGAIAKWFDQSLVCALAEKHPDWNFVLVGTIYTEVERLKGYKNIYLLGRKEYDEVPAYMKYFDVGIIPFVMNDLIINTNPIKFFEYLAAGIKTVATPMPELIDEPYCYLGENAEDFSKELQNILKDKTVKNTEQYLQKNSWSKRAEDILKFIDGDREIVKNREGEIKEIVRGYEKFLNMPLINLLIAEIYNDLGEKEKAIQVVSDNLERIINFSPSIQMRLALEWEEIEYLIALIQLNEGLLGLKDALLWKEKGLDYVKIYMYRILGNYEEAISRGKTLANKDRSILEEVANVYFEMGKYNEANKIYQSLINSKKGLVTLTGVINYSKVASAKKDNELVARLAEPFKEYLNELLNEFLELFRAGELERCIKVGKEFLKNGVAEEDVTKDIHAILGLCYEELKDFITAKVHANKALQLDPVHKEAHELILRLS